MIKYVFLLKLILLPISFMGLFWPKKNRHFFPSYSHQQWSGNHRILFERLYLEGKVDVVSVIPDKYIDIYKSNTVVESSNILLIIYYALSSKYIYYHHGTCDLPLFIFPFNVKTIMLNHGVHYKKTGASLSGFKFNVMLDSIFINKHFVSSELDALCVCSNYYKKINSCVVTGLIRNDVFFNENYNDFYLNDISKIKKIKNRNKKIILYAPTWRDFGMAYVFTDLDILELEGFCERNGYIFLYAGHPYLKGRICPDSEFIIDLNKYDIDIQVVLKYTDVLITDYSSIWIDALLLNIPIYSFCYDYEDYKNYRGEFYTFPDFFPGGTCPNFVGIIEMVEKNNKKENYLFIKRMFHKYDSDIDKSVLSAVEKL